MKPKNLIVLILAVAVICVGLWWFARPSAATPEKNAKAPGPTQAEAAKPVTLPAIVPPVAPATPNPKAAPLVTAADPNASDTQKELTAVLADMVELTRAGNQTAFIEKYMPPALLALVTPQDKADLAKQDATAKGRQDAEEEAQAFASLEDQSPKMNAAGDEATYQMPHPWDADTSSGMPPPPPEPVVLQKIDGKWYLKQVGEDE